MKLFSFIDPIVEGEYLKKRGKSRCQRAEISDFRLKKTQANISYFPMKVKPGIKIIRRNAGFTAALVRKPSS
jgi:hypothetical protein